MSADSLPRRVLKHIFAPLLTERSYRVIQGVAKGWDIKTGSWTEPELEIIPYAVRPGETALDIGANFGLYSYHLSRAVGPTGKVYAFEPVPFTSETLKLVRTMLGFRNVELIAKGCGDKPGELVFTVPIAESGAIISGLVHMGQRNDARTGKEQHARFNKTKQIQCEVVVLDEILPSVHDVSLIKCDIEGADYYALRGANKIIEANHPTVICEMNPWFMEGFGIKVDEMVGFFAGHGYSLYRYEDRRLIPTATKDVYEDNWVFVHPSRHGRLAPLLPPQA
jgi:FkbM family methyltransferase